MKMLFKNLTPLFLILFGLLLLFILGQAEAAGICFLIGIVMTIEKIWPEKWDVDKHKE